MQLANRAKYLLKTQNLIPGVTITGHIVESERMSSLNLRPVDQ